MSARRMFVRVVYLWCGPPKGRFPNSLYCMTLYLSAYPRELAVSLPQSAVLPLPPGLRRSFGGRGGGLPIGRIFPC